MSVTSLVLLSEEKVEKNYFSHISVMAAQPQSLATQAGLVSLELIHANCVNLENGYIKFWLPELSKKDREYEERLDCTSLDVETIVTQFRQG